MFSSPRPCSKTVEVHARSQGKCILYSVTHIMREVESFATCRDRPRGRVQSDEERIDELRDQHGERDLEELFFRLVV